MAGLIGKVYRGAFARMSTMAILMIGGALLYERGVQLASDVIYDRINRGKQWKDVKHLYGG